MDLLTVHRTVVFGEFFKGGEVVDRTVGVQPEKEIRQKLDVLLK